MTTLAYLIGVIATILILKFIYDSYLTNNTEKNWQQFKSNNPEKASKIEGVEFKLNTLNSSGSFDQIEKEKSMKRLAQSYGCETWELKEYVINEFKDKLNNLENDEIRSLFNEQIENESKIYKIKPANTSSKQILIWIEESLIHNKLTEKNIDQEKSKLLEDYFLNFGIEVNKDFTGLENLYTFILEYVEPDLDDTSNCIFDYLYENFNEIESKTMKKIINIGLKIPSDPFVRGNFVKIFTDIFIDEYFHSNNLSLLKYPEKLIKDCLKIIDHTSSENFKILSELYHQLNKIVSFNGNQLQGLMYSMKSIEFENLHDKNSNI